MSAHALHLPPARQSPAMGKGAHGAPGRGKISRTPKERFRKAVSIIKAATGWTSAEVADQLSMSPKAFDHAMSTDPRRGVSVERAQDAEALAQSLEAPVSDADLVRAARELAGALRVLLAA